MLFTSFEKGDFDIKLLYFFPNVPMDRTAADPIEEPVSAIRMAPGFRKSAAILILKAILLP